LKLPGFVLPFFLLKVLLSDLVGFFVGLAILREGQMINK